MATTRSGTAPLLRALQSERAAPRGGLSLAVQHPPRNCGPQVSGVGELQGLGANLVALAPARGALDDVDQLAHVARPAIAAQARLGIAGQAEDSAVTAGEPIREVARQRDDVVGALA